MKTVTLASHEFHANLLYNTDGLLPFFACDARVKEAEGSTGWARFQVDGEAWKARLSYQSSNIVHPGETTPFGTDWRLDEMREYRLKRP